MMCFSERRKQMPKREILPVSYHMAVAEINGRFYPVSLASDEQGELVLDSHPRYLWEVEDEFGIPPAIGPRHTTGVVSFPTYVAALHFCHCRYERFSLIIHLDYAVATYEVYPERNAWYADEIQTLAGMRPYVSSIGTRAYVSVFLRDGDYCRVYGNTIDDGLVNLYERLCVLTQEKEPQSVAI
jgi:hypothetical protein